MRGILIEPMLEDALKKSKAHRFKDYSQAYLFHAACFKKSLEDCGVFPPPKLPSEAERQIALKKLMAANNVKTRRHWGELMDEWWRVLFVFKNGELVSFTTEPKHEKPSEMSTEKYPAWTVRTNVRV